jgi:hypothetical protein
MGEQAVVSFPEFTCWKDEDFRSVRKSVVFRVYSVGGTPSTQFDQEFISDYGVWYHQHDELLIKMLSSVHPGLDWGLLIYHRRWDHSGIDVCDADSGQVVARLEVRQFRGTRLDVLENDLGSNVVRLDDYRTSKLSESDVLELTEEWFGGRDVGKEGPGEAE